MLANISILIRIRFTHNSDIILRFLEEQPDWYNEMNLLKEEVASLEKQFSNYLLNQTTR